MRNVRRCGVGCANLGEQRAREAWWPWMSAGSRGGLVHQQCWRAAELGGQRTHATSTRLKLLELLLGATILLSGALGGFPPIWSGSQVQTELDAETRMQKRHGRLREGGSQSWRSLEDGLHLWIGSAVYISILQPIHLESENNSKNPPTLSSILRRRSSYSFFWGGGQDGSKYYCSKIKNKATYFQKKIGGGYSFWGRGRI